MRSCCEGGKRFTGQSAIAADYHAKKRKRGVRVAQRSEVTADYCSVRTYRELKFVDFDFLVIVCARSRHVQ